MLSIEGLFLQCQRNNFNSTEKFSIYPNFDLVLFFELTRGGVNRFTAPRVLTNFKCARGGVNQFTAPRVFNIFRVRASKSDFNSLLLENLNISSAREGE
jgi:hypothetical protein